MPPKRTSTSAAPAMTQVASRQLVADSVATALKAQAATMAITDNTNKNTGTSETLVARKGTNDHKRKFEFALSGTKLATRWVMRPGTAEAKPREATCDQCL
ncbi:hypothetical protein Tco_0264042, partial [Tanacetum coccineum]